MDPFYRLAMRTKELPRFDNALCCFSSSYLAQESRHVKPTLTVSVISSLDWFENIIHNSNPKLDLISLEETLTIPYFVIFSFLG